MEATMSLSRDLMEILFVGLKAMGMIVTAVDNRSSEIGHAGDFGISYGKQWEDGFEDRGRFPVKNANFDINMVISQYLLENKFVQTGENRWVNPVRFPKARTYKEAENMN